MAAEISDKPKFISTRVLEARRYFLDLNPQRKGPLTVVCGGIERCAADYEISRTTFPYCGIEFVAEGRGLLELAGHRFPLRPGAAFAYAPDVPHHIVNDAQAPMLKYYLDFTGKDARALLKDSPLGRWEAVQVSSPGEVSDLLEALHRNGSTPTPLTPKICAHLLSLVVLKISELAVPIGAPETRSFPTYQRIRRYIEAHFLELRSADQIAQSCHVDVSYLCRLFQRFARQTPYQLLMRLKMERAASLLLEAGMPVKEVAATLQFSDPFHFSRSFKRCYGLSPAAFVQQGRRV